MKIAMTVWGNRVSPVFDSAQTILLAEIKDQSVVWKQREFIAGQIPTRLARMLVDKGIDTLVCGAISEQPATIIEAAGITLVSFVSGSATELLETCAKGIPADGFKMPGCRPPCCRRRHLHNEGNAVDKTCEKPMKRQRNSGCAPPDRPATRLQMNQTKLTILLAGDRHSRLSNLARTLEQESMINLHTASSTEQAWHLLDSQQIDVVIADKQVGEADGLQFIKKVVAARPLINCALVSSLARQDFHEATEGLGLFMQVPENPDSKAAADLLTTLTALYGHLTQHTTNRSSQS